MTDEKSKGLSDPSSLKVGDWIQWTWRDSPEQVTKVKGHKFYTTGKKAHIMGRGQMYSVTEAPKGGNK